MKKSAITLLFSTLLLFGCGKKDDATLSSTESKESVETSVVKESSVQEQEVAVDQFESQTETGEGTFDIASASGSTEDGAEVIIYYDPNTFPTRVVFSNKDIDGSLLSYLYADGQLLDKQQLSQNQSELHLQDISSAITEGKHKIQLVQFEGDTEGGTIVTYKEQPYTIKLK